MATTWYYTTNQQQMGPVTFEELRQLAGQGLLIPTDLVWTEGMRDWMRASSQGLFADGMAAPEKRSSLSAAEDIDEDDRPRRRRREDEERGEDDDEDDARPRRRRRPREDGMPVGLKIGLIVGGSVLALIVVGLGLFFLLRGGSGAGPAVAAFPFNANGSLSPLDQRDRAMASPCKIYNVQMVAGRVYTIDLRSNQFDAFLRLEDNVFRQLAQDDDSGGGLDARIIFRAPRTENYRIIATSLGGGTGNFTLSIREGP